MINRPRLLVSGAAFASVIVALNGCGGGGPPTFSVRVAKALGSRGYDQVRVSVVQDAGVGPAPAAEREVAWSYSSDFQQKWTDMHLSSAVVQIQPGENQTVSVYGHDIRVKVPRQGAGTVGMIVGDPCLVETDWCPYGKIFDVQGTLQTVLNALAAHDELDYWMNVGDLFYDQVGDATRGFFSGLSTDVQATIHGVSVGNHDYWTNGDPLRVTDSDNLGIGLMQWYGQDAMSAKDDPTRPFDFSADPSLNQVAHFSNFFWYNMVGNIAFISFSGQTVWDEQAPYFEEACSWARAQDPDLLVLLGHWDAQNLGCAAGMATPEAYTKMMAIPDCASFGKTQVKYFEGHNHCNQITQPGTGFMLGAFGMAGCGQFGIPILDTRGGQATLWYFELGVGGTRSAQWQEVIDCFKASGLSGCTQYGQAWIQQSLPARRSANTSLVHLV